MSDEYDGTEDFNSAARRYPPPDYVVENHGTIFLVRSNTEQAYGHLVEHVQVDAQWLGKALAVEHRFIADLVRQLREDGFDVEVS